MPRRKSIPCCAPHPVAEHSRTPGVRADAPDVAARYRGAEGQGIYGGTCGCNRRSGGCCTCSYAGSNGKDHGVRHPRWVALPADAADSKDLDVAERHWHFEGLQVFGGTHQQQCMHLSHSQEAALFDLGRECRCADPESHHRGSRLDLRRSKSCVQARDASSRRGLHRPLLRPVFAPARPLPPDDLHQHPPGLRVYRASGHAQL
mmetsp:Transcript_11522/g.22749  ORF Transcript_11522/g.22749 Transcript_11522/m.22749 type:complete len:204 (+) Transcript_11522:315-926(+)